MAWSCPRVSAVPGTLACLLAGYDPTLAMEPNSPKATTVGGSNASTRKISLCSIVTSLPLLLGSSDKQ